MIALFLSLLVASIVGTAAWSMQNVIRRMTEGGLSRTWHYYSAFLPVFFLLGGSEIVGWLFRLLRSRVPDTAANPPFEIEIQSSAGVRPTEQPTGGESFADWIGNGLLWLDHRKEWVLLVIGIWAAGFLVFLAVHLYSYAAYKRALFRECRSLERAGCRLKVVLSAHAATPMLIGFWRPVIVLPDTPIGERELEMILAHELVHFKRGDLYAKLLVFTANAIHWFNPAAYAINKQIAMLCELSCDEQVVRNLDADGRRRYGNTLLSMLEYGVMHKNIAFASGLCNPKKEMKRRLLSLMEKKQTKKSKMALSLAAAVMLVGVGGTAAIAATPASQPQIPTGKQIEGNNIYVQSPDGKIVYYDKNGNATPVSSKGNAPAKKLTTQETVDRVQKHIEKGLEVPQGYINDLPQKELDAINKKYDLKLKKSS